MARLGSHPRPHPLHHSHHLHCLFWSHLLPDPLDHHAQKILEFTLLHEEILRSHGKLSPPHTRQIALLLLLPNLNFAVFQRDRKITLPIQLLHPRPSPKRAKNKQTPKKKTSNLKNSDSRHTRALPRPTLFSKNRT